MVLVVLAAVLPSVTMGFVLTSRITEASESRVERDGVVYLVSNNPLHRFGSLDQG